MEEKRRNILAIINPVSGTGSKDKIPRLIDTAVDHDRNQVSIIMSEYPGHARELAQQAVNDGFDNHVGSSGEGCVLKAKVCSNRTTVYGRDNTAGCIDYANIYYVTVPNCKLYLQVPMSREIGLPETAIDPTGIAPDVRIELPLPKTLTDNVDEWVTWVAEHLEKE